MLLSMCLAVFVLLTSTHVHSLQNSHSSLHHNVSNNFDFIFNTTLADKEERNNFNAIKSFNRCKCIDSLIDFQYQYKYPSEFFSKHNFLSHIRDKTFAIMGDSLGLQMFYSLDASLMSERSSVNLTLTRPKNKYQLDRGVSTYQKYNASLQFFQTSTILQAMPFLLSEHFLHIDILLIVIGAWYKPGFQNYIPRHNLTEATDDYNTTMHELRSAIIDHHHASSAANMQRPLQVIWQLNMHMGPSDDTRYKHLANHYNGSFWDQFPHEAKWVPIFNDVIRRVASQHDDSILDTYTISKQLLRHANALRQSWQMSSSPSYSFPYFSCLKVHSDSLHYCQGGVYRASALLLQKLLQYMQSS